MRAVTEMLGAERVWTRRAAMVVLAAGREVLIADDEEQLAARTLDVLGDPGLRERLAHEGRRAVEERYGWERIGAEMEAWVRSVAAARRAGERP